MYYFIEFLYLISSVSSLRLSIDGGGLKPRWYTNDNSNSLDTWRRADTSGHALDTSNTESSDSSSDASKEIHLAISEVRTPTKKRKKTGYPQTITTSFTTKYERGTTRRREYFRAQDKHHKRHGNKKDIQNVLGFGMPQPPQNPLLVLNSDEKITIPAIYKKKQTEKRTEAPQKQRPGKPVTQLGWFDDFKNITDDFSNKINQFQNQTNQWGKELQNKTAQLNQLEKQANQWKQNTKNTSQQLEDKIKEYNKGVQNWQDQMKNKTQKELNKLNDLSNQANKWQEQAKDKQKELGDKANELGNKFGNEANKWQGQVKDKQKELGDQFGGEADKWKGQVKDKQKELGDKFGSETDKWKGQAKDKQKELGDKFGSETDKWKGQAKDKQKELGDKFGSETDKWKGQAKDKQKELGDKFGSEADKWKGQAKDKQKELGDKFGSETDKWKGQAKDKQKELGDKFGGEADKWKGQAKDKQKELGDKFGSETDKWKGQAKDKQKELGDKFGSETDKWKGQAKDKQKELGDKFGSETDKWKGQAKDKQKELGDKFGGEADKWKGQAKDKQKELGGKFGGEAEKWKGQAKDKQKELGDKFGSETDKWKGQAKDKHKELRDEFGDIGDKIGDEAHNWHKQIVDTQKDIADKIGIVGKNTGKEANKWQDELVNKPKDLIGSKLSELGNQANTYLQGQIKDKQQQLLDQAGNIAMNEMQKQSGDLLEKAAGNLLEKAATDTFGKIKDNVPLSSFTKNILTRTLNLFDKIKKRSTEYHWKKKVKRLAKNYEDKYKEFLRTTNNQRIRTRLGTQKVILNAVDMSQSIVNRLVNMMISEMDKKGLLRTSHTQDLFFKEIKNEVNSELQHACLNLGVCVTHSGYTQTIMDLLTKMLKLDNVKFKQAFDSLTEAGKAADFSRSLGKRNNKALKRIIAYLENKSVNTQRGMIMITKNIVANRNKPLVLTTDTDPVECNLNQTLAFLEIIDTLDKNVPDTKDNIRKLYDLKVNMNGWSRGENIQYTMDRFISLTVSVIDALNVNAWHTVRNNANILLK